MKRITMGELYTITLARNEVIKNSGYNLIYIWEDRWDYLIRKVRVIQRAWRKWIKINGRVHKKVRTE